jgi:hypothetical protein
LAAALVTGISVATPASASTLATITSVSWNYVDSAAPHTSFGKPEGGLPVGAHVDPAGVAHVSKSYVTVDISALRGTDILSAFLLTAETAVNDCGTTRETEVWLTDPARRPTWARQPVERTQLAGPSAQSGCPAPGLGWDAAAALRQALAADWSTATFVLRMPDAQQTDPHYGRAYDPAVRIALNYNRAPLRPTNLAMNGVACGAQPLPIGAGTGHVPGRSALSAVITDPDADPVGARFAWWPVDHPDQRTEIDAPRISSGAVQQATLLTSQLTDGVTYAWQVRGIDGQDDGPWSAVSRFTVDLTAPAVAPTVSSAVYPESSAPPGTGGTGVTGAFTFTANGVNDVVRFGYGVDGAFLFVAADHPGGSATIQLTPNMAGPDRLDVFSQDAGGNSSPVTSYSFFVADNEPIVSCTPTAGFIGVPRQCVFTPRGAGTVVGYSYSLHGSPVTVPAGPDGSATVTVIPTNADGPLVNLSVAAQLAGGTTMQPAQVRLQVDPADPVVVQSPDQPVVGTPIRFTFQPVLPGLVSYTYVWDGGAPVTVPAGADGTATVTLTADRDFPELDVFSTGASGIVSGTTTDFAFLASNQPTVTSTDYPESGVGGGVGVPGRSRSRSRRRSPVWSATPTRWTGVTRSPCRPVGMARPRR